MRLGDLLMVLLVRYEVPILSQKFNICMYFRRLICKYTPHLSRAVPGSKAFAGVYFALGGICFPLGGV
jgi:hypothetical protein